MSDPKIKHISERKRPQFTGRGKGPPFLAIHHSIADSSEFGEIGPHALKLLLELARKYRPGKNGDLEATWEELRTRGWRSKATLHEAKKELIDRGWIIETRKGGSHKCSLYALTYYPIDGSEKHQEPATAVPPNLWRRREAA